MCVRYPTQEEVRKKKKRIEPRAVTGHSGAISDELLQFQTTLLPCCTWRNANVILKKYEASACFTLAGP